VERRGLGLMTQSEQELLDRLRVLERWAMAHECEQRQHRIFLAENGANRDVYTRAAIQHAQAFIALPWTKEAEELLGKV
jgi:hypothetical protein